MRESPQAITHVMQPALPGCLTVMTVGAADETTRIYCHRLKNADAGLPGQRHTGATVRGKELPILQRKEDCLTVDIPPGKYAALALSLVAKFDPAMATIINMPRLDWAYPSVATAGQTFRLFGRNLVAADRYKTTDPANPISYGGYQRGKTRVVARAVAAGDAGHFVEIPVAQSNGYEVFLDVPADLAPGAGAYDLFAHNGLGGALGWSRPLRVEVQAAAPWPTQVFRVDDFAARDAKGGVDAAIGAALEAIRANGGGVLEFGRGVYELRRTIVVPRRTVVRGAGARRTKLQLPQGGGPAAPFVAITGDGDFIVEDLRLFSLYAPLLIVAPTFTPDNFDDAYALAFNFSAGRRCRNVTVRRCHLTMRINSHEDRRTDTDKGKYKQFVQAYMLSQSQSVGGFSAITLRGEDINIEDNVIFGGGACVMLHGCTQARVAGNRLEIGAAGHGIYAIAKLLWPTDGIKAVNHGAIIEGNHCRQLVIEDNFVTGAAPTARDGIYLIYGTERTHVARNRILNIQSTFDAEGFGMHLWSARWASAGLEMETPTRGRIVDPQDEVKYETLDGAQVEIVAGHGMGQVRRIMRREGSTVELDEPWAFAPDATSRVVYTAPPLFHKITVVDNEIEDTGANLIMWGCANDVVVDGNRLADGPHLGVWSVRVQGDQKVWGGAAFVSVINNLNEMGWISPGPGQNALLHTGGGMIGNPSCAFGDSEKLGYDHLGLLMRHNAAIGDSGIFFRKTWPLYGSDELWVEHDYGVVVEANLCKDSKLGVVIEEGAAAVERNNRFENVDQPVTWEKPFKKV